MYQKSKTSTFSTLKQASDWLQQGKLLVYPTESVWGIGCDAYDEQAVHAILDIKRRPIDKGVIVVTDSVERIAHLLTPLSNEQRRTVLASWQTPSTNQSRQAHTWLLPTSNHSKNPLHIPPWITGKHDSVAVRIISHPLVAKLCASFVSKNNPYGFLVSTSCNTAGDTPAKTFDEAMAYFSHDPKVGFLNGSTLNYELPSQIRDAVTGQLIR